MKLGDARMEMPFVDSEIMLGNRQKRPCRVVYIHPAYRFYTVEFCSELGWKFRQSYFFEDRDPDGPALPDHLRFLRRPVCATGRGCHGPRHRWLGSM